MGLTRCQAAVLGGVVAMACGAAAWASSDNFPDALFSDRTGFLAAPILMKPRDIAALVTAKDGMRPKEDAGEEATFEKERAAAELAGAGPEQRAAIAAMRAAKSGDEAWGLGAALPPAVRLYTAGAVDFHAGRSEAARQRFEAVLSLPGPAAAPRAAWAATMLGRIAAAAGKPDMAVAQFRRVRDAVLAGAADPLGLAVASYGSEAHVLRFADHPPSEYLPLYLAQEAHGSASALASVDFLTPRILADPAALRLALADPGARAEIIAHEMVAHEDYQAPEEPETVRGLFDAVLASRTPADPVDALAALAYEAGEYDRAAALVAGAAEPFSSWLRAKLALRRGDDAAAVALFAHAVERAAANGETPALPYDRLAIEFGAMQVRRGDFVLALSTLWHAKRPDDDFSLDIDYLAERVLTVDELKAFVDADVPAIALDKPDYRPFPPPAFMRHLLAMRLMREGRKDAALPYFPTESLRRTAADYLGFMQGAEAGPASGRAASFWAAAKILRSDSKDLMGTELTTAFADTDCRLDFSAKGYDDRIQAKKGEYVRAERVRYDSSAPHAAMRDGRYHYRYMAWLRLDSALALVPPRSQAAAAMLCHGATWMRRLHNEPAKRAIWERYVRTGAAVPFAPDFSKTCPEPDFADAPSTPRKLMLIEAHDTLHRHKRLIGAGGGLAVILAVGGGAVMLRRRPPAGPPS